VQPEEEGKFLLGIESWSLQRRSLSALSRDDFS